MALCFRSSVFLVGSPANLGRCCSALISYHLFVHDMSALFLPVMLSLAQAIRADTPRARLTLSVVSTIFLSPLIISYAGSYFFLACLPVIALLALYLKWQT